MPALSSFLSSCYMLSKFHLNCGPTNLRFPSLELCDNVRKRLCREISKYPHLLSQRKHTRHTDPCKNNKHLCTNTLPPVSSLLQGGLWDLLSLLVLSSLPFFWLVRESYQEKNMSFCTFQSLLTGNLPGQPQSLP